MTFPLTNNNKDPSILLRLSELQPGWGVAAIVDTETTGLDPRRHEVVELAIVLFAFDRHRGHVYGVVDEYSGLRESQRPITKAAQQVHGITQDDVRGCRIDGARVHALLSQAEFLVSHNAAFDCAFLARLFPMVLQKPWLCSMNGVAWYRRGHTSKSLAALLRDHGVPMTNAHRALDDARSTLVLLSLPGPEGEANLSELLRRSHAARVR